MAKTLLARYVWLADTISRHGRISRRQIDELWSRSPFSQGEGIPRRTFFNYRAAIEEIFNLNIQYDARDACYFIADRQSSQSDVIDYMVDSMAMTSLLSDSREVADLIVLEDIPSAREHLTSIVHALKEKHAVVFDYHPFNRSGVSVDVEIEPYFVKLFRQRWYVTGRRVADDKVKTYALDRVRRLRATTHDYAIPDEFEPRNYFRDCFGIVHDSGEPRNVVLKVTPAQAKYFRALPLHHSQQEELGDGYSLFRLRLRISEDFLRELLQYGCAVHVLEPKELRAMVVDRLQTALSAYEGEESATDRR